MSKKTREELEHLLRMWTPEAREAEIAKRLGEEVPDSSDTDAELEKAEIERIKAKLDDIDKQEELEKAEKKAKTVAKAKATREKNKAKKLADEALKTEGAE